MSLRRPSKQQPENFEFNTASLKAAEAIVTKYPKDKKQSAVMGLLFIACTISPLLEKILYKFVQPHHV